MIVQQPTQPAISSMNSSLVARSSPAGLAWIVTEQQYLLPPHIQILNRKLIDVAAGRCKRLIVCMPPRHGKSEIISRFFPAWFVGNYPSHPLILTSYEADFAASWGRKIREIIESHGQQFFGVRLDPKARASDSWYLEGYSNGGVRTAGA